MLVCCVKTRHQISQNSQKCYGWRHCGLPSSPSHTHLPSSPPASVVVSESNFRNPFRPQSGCRKPLQIGSDFGEPSPPLNRLLLNMLYVRPRRLRITLIASGPWSPLPTGWFSTQPRRLTIPTRNAVYSNQFFKLSSRESLSSWAYKDRH